MFNTVRISLVCISFLSPVACFHSVAEICGRKFAESNQNIDSAIQEIQREYAQLQKNRSPASGNLRGQWKRWETWAEDHLKSTQKYMDIVGPHGKVRPLRHQISIVADQWVVFHGYAQLGDTQRMVDTLQLIKSYQTQAQSSACNLDQSK